MRRLGRLLALLVMAAGTAALAAFAPAARAQAPAPDSYEENDSLLEAAAIPMGAHLNSLAISPVGTHNDTCRPERAGDLQREQLAQRLAQPGNYEKAAARYKATDEFDVGERAAKEYVRLVLK